MIILRFTTGEGRCAGPSPFSFSEPLCLTGQSPAQEIRSPPLGNSSEIACGKSGLRITTLEDCFKSRGGITNGSNFWLEFGSHRASLPRQRLGAMRLGSIERCRARPAFAKGFVRDECANGIASLAQRPQWSPQNRPFMVISKPAIN